MGNIISDNKGNINGKNQSSAFAQNINDTLLELDLYNLGKYDINNPATSNTNPRSEIDYTTSGIANSTDNLDQSGHGRPVANNQLIDIMGIPYTDVSITTLPSPLPSTATNLGISFTNLTASNPNDLYSHRLYNIKRGFCNATTTVPVDIVGVDLPFDDTDVVAGLTNNNQSTNIISSAAADQKGTTFNYPTDSTTTKMSTVIDNCLTWGSKSAPAGQSFFTTDSTGAQVPNVAIPDMTNLSSSETLNSLAQKNVYGNTLSPECVDILNNTLINSYISSDLAQYSKFASSNISNDGIKNMGFYDDPVSNTSGLVPTLTGNVTNLISGGTPISANSALYGSGTWSVNGNRDQNQTNGSCANLETDLCNWYYYYDINDGLLYNPTFNTNKYPVGNFSNNVKYLTEHIPDCRCQAFNNLNNPGGLSSDDTKNMTVYYTNYKCNISNNYGQKTDIVTGETITATSGTGSYVVANTGGTGDVKKLFNQNNNNLNYIGYRRQFDPASTSSGLNGGNFLYVPYGIRGSTNTFNSYSCTLSQNINVSGVAGNAIIQGNTAVCNIGVAAAAPSPSKTNTGNGVVTSTTVSISTVSYGSPPNKPINSTDPPLNVGDTIKVDVTYPANSAAPLNFIGNYQFVVYLVSDNTQSVVLPPINLNGCGGNMVNGLPAIGVGATSCLSPYTINTPFIYGSTTNVTGIPYSLVLTSTPTGANKITATNGYTLNLKQYSMRISYVSTKVINSKNVLYIGVNMNTTDIFNLRIQVRLKPVSTATGTSIPSGCTASSSSTSSTSVTDDSLYQVFTSFKSLIDGALYLGDNITIQPIKYYYSIILNGTPSTTGYGPDTGGYNMLYDNSMPKNQQCIVDFSNTSSSFINTTLQYIDYDNNNSINFVSNKDTVKFGATLLFSWQFNSSDASDTIINIYYDTAITYSATSSTAVKITGSTGFPLNGTSTITSSYLSNTFTFVCPIGINSPIIIYGVVNKANNIILKSNVISITPTQTTNYKNWQISQNTATQWWISPDMTSTKVPLTLDNNKNATIDYYFNLANSTTSPYKYIIYDKPTANWYGGNGTPTQSSATGASPLYTIFTKPDPTKLPSINIVSINNTTIGTTPSPLSISFGASVKLVYTITPLPTYTTNIQVVIGSTTNNNIRQVIYSFPISASSSITPLNFLLFYDITINNPSIYITSYNTFTSKIIPLNVTLGNIQNVPMLSAQAILSNASQLINISSSSTSDILLNKMAITYTTPYPDNKYYVIMSGFSATLPLTVTQSKFTFGRLNFNIPLNFTITLPINQPFTNVDNGKLMIESFYGNTQDIIEHVTPVPNVINIKTLQFDLSSSITSPTININYMFTGYSTVNIQNLELLFGNNPLDNLKFNLAFLTNTISSINTIYQISTITLIGNLNTSISIVQQIPGLTNVMYSVGTPLIANNYPLIVPLIYSNGLYTLPETYSTQLTRAVNNATLKPPAVPVAADNATTTTGLSTEQLVLIMLGVLGFIGLIAFIYFKFLKKK